MTARVVVVDKFVEGDNIFSGKDVIFELFACLSNDLRLRFIAELKEAIESTSTDGEDGDGEAAQSLALLLVAQKYANLVMEEFKDLGK